MNRIKELITTSLKYYDINNQNYENLFNKMKYYSVIKSDSDVAHNILVFYDKHKKEILKSRYEFLGLYEASLKLWIWGWAIPQIQKNKIFLSRKLLNYALDLAPNEELNELKTELITSRFIINNNIQLDIHISLASYIAKNPMVYPIIDDLDQQESSKIEKIKKINKKITNTSTVTFCFLLDPNGVE